jgi:hypothetical protein
MISTNKLNRENKKVVILNNSKDRKYLKISDDEIVIDKIKSIKIDK